MGAGMTLEAVVFDFDGLIIDSEWVIYETARSVFALHGHELSVEAWSVVVGLGDDSDDSAWPALLSAAGVETFDVADYTTTYEAQDRTNRNELPALPGVEELLESLGAAGVPVGIASSSTRDWLDRHVDRLGLAEHFKAIVGSDMVGGVGKPAPDVYLQVCRDLAVDPAASVALEDSAHGVTSANAAGMRAVAVPSRITRYHDLGHADLVVDSVADLSVATLASLLDRPRR